MLTPERDLTRTMSRKDKTITRLFERNPTLILRQTQNQLREKSINIQINIIRCLYEWKIKYRSTIQKFHLTQKHVTKQLA